MEPNLGYTWPYNSLVAGAIRAPLIWLFPWRTSESPPAIPAYSLLASALASSAPCTGFHLTGKLYILLFGKSSAAVIILVLSWAACESFTICLTLSGFGACLGTLLYLRLGTLSFFLGASSAFGFATMNFEAKANYLWALIVWWCLQGGFRVHILHLPSRSARRFVSLCDSLNILWSLSLSTCRAISASYMKSSILWDPGIIEPPSFSASAEAMFPMKDPFTVMKRLSSLTWEMRAVYSAADRSRSFLSVSCIYLSSGCSDLGGSPISSIRASTVSIFELNCLFKLLIVHLINFSFLLWINKK